MKKKFLLLFCFASIFIAGCKDSSSTYVRGMGIKTRGTAKIDPIDITLDKDNIVSYDSLQKAFKLDYTAVKPEEPLDLTKIQDYTASEGTSENVIPGVRPLSDYKTKYSSERKDVPTNSVIQSETLEEDEKKIPFSIVSWGPEKNIVAENENPTFYVIFSKPVRPLTATEAPSDKSDVLSISPSIKGVFRWYGTSHLSFEASEPADPSVEYTIKVKSDLKSLSGQKITGETTFKTKASDVVIENIYGGYIKDSDYNASYSGAKPPYENRFLVKTNYPMTEDAFRKAVTVKTASKASKYSVELDYSNKLFYWGYPSKSDSVAKKSNTFIVTVKDPVPHNTDVSIQVNSTKQSRSYSTLKPFTLDYVSSYCGSSSENKKYPLTMTFSQEPEKTSLLNNLYLSVNHEFNDSNVSIDGYNVTLFNLPFDPDSQYELYFGDGIKDIYGQQINLKNDTYIVKTRRNAAYVKYIDDGIKMMEAQFPHKILFEHMNINAGGKYTLRKVDNPVFNSWNTRWKAGEGDSGYISIEPGYENERTFKEVNLDQYLNNGYGFVKFQAEVPYDAYSWWDDDYRTYTAKDELTIQVTDLGVTARTGINKAVVMVRSLSTNKPVPNATVKVCCNLTDFDGDPLTKSFASRTTDSNGFAVINYTEEELADLNRMITENDGYCNGLFIYVVYGDDKAVFRASTHNMWRDNVDTSSISSARVSRQKTFMFVDRGIYRPGETVTFRGIDKDQILGAFVSHKGKYTIKVASGWWDGPEVNIEPITGELSDIGGFWGSFKLPDDIETGSYEIQFFRGDDVRSYSNACVYFQVANFERAKFQSSVTIPDMVYYGGDSISAEISAEYLAGGALTGAEYQTSWFRQAVPFTSDAPETKGYKFAYSYEGRNYYSNSKGKLSTSGKGNSNCQTEKIKNGTPYMYRVEAAVTDISNQRLSAAASVVVHSSQYYVGLKRNGNGYPKKGDKVEIPYILVGADGHILSEADSKIKAKKLDYELSREVWTMVNEQSVNSSVYARYERSEEIEASGKVDIKSEGKLTLTPPESGWYTLKVYGTDNKDNYVETKIEFYVTGGRSFWYGDDADSITLTPDQSMYNPGDKAQILVQSPLPEGDYLITVEREGIFTEELRHIDGPTTVIEVPIAGNYVPVVYVSISSYSIRSGAPKHQYGEVDVDKPKGYYGVTPVFVNPYVKAFSVDVFADKLTYKPGEEVTLKLTAFKGDLAIEGAELTVMAVDRGVVDLINYHVPNPIDFFYNDNNYPLCVNGGDSRDYLMDPVTYSIKNLQGGDSDDDEKSEDSNIRKDFRPTAVFEPALVTGKDGTVECKFKLPDSLTTYRITVFGVKENLFALQESEVKVQNNVNIQQVQPRKLRERDTAECGVLITNLENEVQDVSVSLEVRSPSGNTVQDEQEGRITVPGKAFVDGKKSNKVKVYPGQSSVVYFDVAAEKEGTVELVYTIKSKALNETLISPVKIEKSYVYETVTLIGSTTDETTAKRSEQIVIPGWAKDGKGEVAVTLDATRLGMLGSAVNYLFEYPYGCMEQQSARVLPLVIFGDYIDVFGMDTKVKDIKKCVTSFTKKWGLDQSKEGGFPYWPGSLESNDYVTARIGMITAMALKNGYTEDELGYEIEPLKNYLENAFIRLKKASDKLSNSEYKSQYSLETYICYVMSLLGDNRLSSYYNDLYAKRNYMTNEQVAYLGMALKAAGQKDKAEVIAKEIRSFLQPSERSVTLLEKRISGYYGRFWYSSSSSEMAVILEFLVSMDSKDAMVDRLLYSLLMSQSCGYWNSTSSTNTVLQAIYTYIKARNLDNVDFTATASINGKKVAENGFKGVGTKPKTIKLPFEDSVIAKLTKDAPVPVSFEKKGTGSLYYTLEMKYALPDEMQTARDEGINITYVIEDCETGEIVNKSNDKSSLLKLQSGKLYKASIMVNSKRDRNYLAVRSPIPSGAEILDASLVTTGYVEEGLDDEYDWWSFSRHWLSNKNLLDNEVQYFWDEFSAGSATVTYTFRAARRGVYPVPPVQAECMYEPEVFGRSDGYLVVIE